MSVLPGGVLCLVVGDVMTADIGAAIAMHQLSSMLRAVPLDQPGPPSEIVRKLEPDTDLDGDTMATLIVATLEQHSATWWRLRWTSAGRLPPLLVSATGGDCYLAHGEEHGTMLGVDPSPRRPDHEHDLTPGSALLSCTDELIQRPHRTLDEGMSLLARHAGAPAGQRCAAVVMSRPTPRYRVPSRNLRSRWEDLLVHGRDLPDDQLKALEQRRDWSWNPFRDGHTAKVLVTAGGATAHRAGRSVDGAGPPPRPAQAGHLLHYVSHALSCRGQTCG